mmetsp:Transcript_52072/g.144279  ORF Transcript_52072/g.144279 Transcript_52072/m.144279 type:complete len:322 (+) Transcript_52072:537-1502(+)
MWRRRALFTSLPGKATVATIFAFFFGASLPTSGASSSRASMPLGPPERNQTSTTVNWPGAEHGLLAMARLTTSPHAARGWAAKPDAAATISCAPRASPTGVVARSRKRCRSAQESLEACTSGLQVRAAPWRFQAGSPSVRLTLEEPAGPTTRAAGPSPRTLPPARASSARSSGSPQRPCALPSGTATERGPASQSVTSQVPSTAVKRCSPNSSATAAPQPSLMSGRVSNNSSSNSWKLFTRAALTKVSLTQPGGRDARFSRTFLWKFLAQNSAAAGPGSPALDCPSNKAKRPIGAWFAKRPVAGSSTLLFCATFLRHFTRT